MTIDDHGPSNGSDSGMVENGGGGTFIIPHPIPFPSPFFFILIIVILVIYLIPSCDSGDRADMWPDS